MAHEGHSDPDDKIDVGSSSKHKESRVGCDQNPAGWCRRGKSVLNVSQRLAGTRRKMVNAAHGANLVTSVNRPGAGDYLVTGQTAAEAAARAARLAGKAG